MSKPYGMTAGFQIIKPTRAQDAVWDAVQEARISGMSVEEFRRECAEAWAQGLRDAAKESEQEWMR